MAVEKILVVDDEPFIAKSISETLRTKRYSVSTADSLAKAERLLKRDTFDVMLLDVNLPDGKGTDLLERLAGIPQKPLIIMMSGAATLESAIACIRFGAFDYLLKPFALSQVEVLIKKAESFGQVLKVSQLLSHENAGGTEDLIGAGPRFLELKQLIKKVAPTEATVLINGENGTGKELVASEIFKASGRAGAPYIRVNCAAISETLIESEFFGHEKGSFTGATERREGRFELANGGTILLDEISEIPIRLQAKLLRVLQEREFERVGGTHTMKVDVRVLATTNRNLKKAVAAGEFREDLFYRLNVFPLQVAPLRERREDITLLAEHFLRRFERRHGLKIPGFSKEALDQVQKYDWPGNVRELQNTIERAVILTEDGKPIQSRSLGLIPGDYSSQCMAEDLAPVARVESESRAAAPTGTALQRSENDSEAGAGDEFLSLQELEKRQTMRALDRTGGNRTKAALLLGISIRTLRNKLHEYRLEDLPQQSAGNSRS
ncbi:MAG TPA: sigma-54 dependent transcriptional regulator [Chthoniobacterales bacterium]|jgi:DNA-binding NtrC family response regulator|nr:sigma-54 dependent transcriptional regulator [Chthoniobacterales bacterium]